MSERKRSRNNGDAASTYKLCKDYQTSDVYIALHLLHFIAMLCIVCNVKYCTPLNCTALHYIVV